MKAMRWDQMQIHKYIFLLNLQSWMFFRWLQHKFCCACKVKCMSGYCRRHHHWNNTCIALFYAFWQFREAMIGCQVFHFIFSLISLCHKLQMTTHSHHLTLCFFSFFFNQVACMWCRSTIIWIEMKKKFLEKLNSLKQGECRKSDFFRNFGVFFDAHVSEWVNSRNDVYDCCTHLLSFPLCFMFARFNSFEKRKTTVSYRVPCVCVSSHHRKQQWNHGTRAKRSVVWFTQNLPCSLTLSSNETHLKQWSQIIIRVIIQ